MRSSRLVAALSSFGFVVALADVGNARAVASEEPSTARPSSPEATQDAPDGTREGLPVLSSTLAPPPGKTASKPGGALPAHVLAVNFGLASAVGVAGVTYMYAGLAPLELEAGFGEGHSGVLVSAMAKLSFGTDEHRFVAGAGLANTVIAGSEVRGHPLWLNLDVVGYEHRKDHLFLGAAAGYTALLSASPGCVRDASCRAGADAFSEAGPQFRILMGTTF